LVGVLVDDGAVFEGAGFGFVGVDDEVDGFAGFAVNEVPFDARGEAGAAASADAGFFDFVDEFGGWAGDGAAEGFVAAVALVAGEVGRVAGFVDVAEDDAVLVRCFGHVEKFGRLLLATKRHKKHKKSEMADVSFL